MIFLGPLPPPVHGFSWVSKEMFLRLKAAEEIDFFVDLAPHSFFITVLSYIRFFFALIKIRSRPTIYIAVSGGLRQLLDILFVAIGLIFKCNFYVHHHSFSYLNSKKLYSKLLMYFLRRATHIVLCERMKQVLFSGYSISQSSIVILSNAVFVDDHQSKIKPVARGTDSLSLGFLSNITTDKGIFIFFDTLDVLCSMNINFSARIAGPLAEDIKSIFTERLSHFTNVIYVGAVYGQDKVDFFGEVDILLFPTLYANEAEPVTLWEAMANSVPVIALQRGCIQGMVPNFAGKVVVSPEDFVDTVKEQVLAFNADADIFAKCRTAAREAFVAARASSRTTLDGLLIEMTSNTAKQKPS